MNMATNLICTIGLMTTVPASLACERPIAVEIPNGLTATEQDMRDASAATQAFIADMQSYLDCLEAERDVARSNERTSGKAEIETRENLAIRAHNTAAKEMEDVAAQFNKAVADFKSKK